MNRTNRPRTFDPITFQLLWSRAISIADEIAATLVKTAFSHVVRDNHDYACAIYDRSGRMLAQSNQCTPGQIGAMPKVVQDFLAAYPAETLVPGDVLITNDPWIGAGHTPDVFVGTPAFRAGRLAGFAVTCAHHIDIGGRLSAPDAREVYEEGLILPITKLFRAGQPNDDLFRLVRRNVRMPDKVIGDLRAQVAANDLGARRIVELLEQSGQDTLDPLAEAIVDHTEKAMRRAIAGVADGTYRHMVEVEERDGAGERVRIVATVEIRGEEATIDFTGSSAQVDLPINAVRNIAYAYCVFPLKAALCPEIPNNAGCAAPIHMKVPDGTVMSAEFPAPCMWRTSLVYHAVEAVFGALVGAIPGKVMAPSGTYPLWLGIFSGRHDDGHPFVQHFNAQGGQGARRAADGVSTTVFPGNVANTPIEFLETESPLLCEEKLLLPDSGGPGRTRGGLGQAIVLRSTARDPVLCTMVGGRLDQGAPGLEGGAAGRGGEIRLNDGPPLTASRQVLLRHRDRLRLRYPGGGGFGDPFQRAPEAVLADVRRGLVSRERAQADYGVVLLADLSGIDRAATALSRASR